MKELQYLDTEIPFFIYTKKNKIKIKTFFLMKFRNGGYQQAAIYAY